MNLHQKSQIWEILTKYEDKLCDLCNSLSNILQGIENRVDYLTVFGNYLKMDFQDSIIVDSILGKKIKNFL
jgi:hypothetical protein